MQSILKEQGFQQTGCTSNECAVQIGQLLGVQFMVVGTIGKLDNTFTVNVRMISIETGEIVAASVKDCTCKSSELLSKVIPELAKDLCSSNKMVPTLKPARYDSVKAKQPSKNPGNALFAEFLGKVPWYTLNYEFRANNNIAFDIGAGLSNFISVGGSFNYLPGKKPCRFETALNASWYAMMNGGMYSGFIISPVLGFRYQKSNGFFFRFNAGPVFLIYMSYYSADANTLMNIAPMFGLSFGYSF
jgi:hypothetical protein